MSSDSPILTDEARKLVLDAIRTFSKLLENQDIALLPEIFVENTKRETSVVVVHGGSDMESATAEDHLATGRELLEQLRNCPEIARNAALAYDGYLTSGGEKTSAIVVEMLGRGVTHTFAQRYAIRKGGEIELIGEPTYLVQPRSESSTW